MKPDEKSISQQMDDIMLMAQRLRVQSAELVQTAEDYLIDTLPVKQVYIDLMERVQGKHG